MMKFYVILLAVFGYMANTGVIFAKPVINNDLRPITEVNHTKTKVVIILNNKRNFASQLTKKNAKYIIKEPFNLNDTKGKDTIVIPASCTLKFEGGSLNNVVLKGNNTKIEADSKQIFGRNCKLIGTWNVSESYPEWFGAKGDGKTDDTKAIQKTINTFATIRLETKTYICNNLLTVGPDKTIVGNKGVLKCLKEGKSQFVVRGDNTTIRGIIFENVSKGYPEFGYDNGGVNSTNVVYQNGISNITIEECTFKNAICGVYIHSACKDITINKCVFNGFKALPNNHNNTMKQCAGGYGICLDADNSDKKDIDNIYRVKVTDCVFRNVQRHCIYVQCVYDMLIDNNIFHTNRRSRVHPNPFDATLMIKNSVDLKIMRNEFVDALEAMHMVKIGKLPYNQNELKNIIIDNNRFYNCGDDRGNNGVIGADYGDYITVSNNSFMSIKGRMGAVIGLNHNYSVSIINNNIEVSDKCPMNSNIVKLNSSNISNVKVIRNRVDFSKTGKKSDKLVSASYAVQEIVVKDNNVIGGNSIEVIDIPKAVHKYVSGNKVKLK